MVATIFLKRITGSEKCAVCGSDCGTDYLQEEVIKDSFQRRELFVCPASKYVCDGCATSFKESVDLEYKGVVRKNQKYRTYSWYLSVSEQKTFTKADLIELQQYILDPPNMRFAICVSDMGKKHLLWRTPVALSKNDYYLQFEEEKVLVNVKRLRQYLDFLAPLVEACGKKTLMDGIFTAKVFGLPQEIIEGFIDYIRLKDDPLMSLALWLTPSANKEKNVKEVKDESIDDRTAPSRVDRAANKEEVQLYLF